MYSIYVEDFMLHDVKFIYHKMTYEQLKQVLLDNRKLTRLPLVDNPKSRILLGSIQRMQLIKLLEKQVGRERRLEEAARRVKQAEEERKTRSLPSSEILVIRPPGKSPVEKVIARLVTSLFCGESSLFSRRQNETGFFLFVAAS